MDEAVAPAVPGPSTKIAPLAEVAGDLTNSAEKKSLKTSGQRSKGLAVEISQSNFAKIEPYGQQETVF